MSKKHRLKGKQSPWFLIDQNLSAANLVRRVVPGDGNCMFHAIAQHCPFSHKELRLSVVSFLKDNIDDFRGFFSEDEDIDSYLNSLSHSGTWGDNLVLSACSELLQTPIHIAQTHGVQVITPALVTNRPIWIAYDGSSHYDAILPLQPSSQEVFSQDNESQDFFPQNGSNSDQVPNSDPLIFNSHSKRKVTWRFLSANITSFNAQQDLLPLLLADITALQETRHTAKSQHGFTLFLRKHKFHAVWGKPQPFRFAKSKTHTSAGLNGRPGGVAIVARSHIPIQFVPPGECPIRKRLYHSGRWVHAVVAYGNGKQTLHVFSIYGFSGHYSHSAVADLNEAFLHDILEVTSQLGPDAPVLVLGDINVEPEASPVLSHALSKGLLNDLGMHCGPTFYPTHGKARRLDVALGTKAVAAAFESLHALQDTGLPGHLPLALELNIPSFSEIVPRLRKPASLPESIPQKLDVAETILETIEPPNPSDVNSIYQHFSQVAEKYLLAASGLTSKKISRPWARAQAGFRASFLPARS